jgi:hypothetical protein
MRKHTSLRLPLNMKAAIDLIASAEGLSFSAAMLHVLEVGLTVMRKRLALGPEPPVSIAPTPHGICVTVGSRQYNFAATHSKTDAPVTVKLAKPGSSAQRALAALDPVAALEAEYDTTFDWASELEELSNIEMSAEDVRSHLSSTNKILKSLNTLDSQRGHKNAI